MVKAAWFRNCAPNELPEKFDRILQSWDTPTRRPSSAISACAPAGGSRARTSICSQLIQELIEHGLHPVTRYQPQSDKIMRSRRCQRLRLSRQAKLRFAESMHAQTAMIENDFVHLPKEAAWLVEYLHELPVFPKGKHDDQVDSTAQIGSEAGEVMAAVQTAMLAKLPYTVLRDAVIAHLTIAEGLGPLLANVPPRGRQ